MLLFCQCITSDLGRSGEGSIELVAWGRRYIILILILGISDDGSNKWKSIMQCKGSKE